MPATALLARRRALRQELAEAQARPITWTQEEIIDRLLDELTAVENEIVALMETEDRRREHRQRVLTYQEQQARKVSS
jgi:uncharacterized NAD(P)/FAD-binding protein YdhS